MGLGGPRHTLVNVRTSTRRTSFRWIAPAAAAGLVIATPGLLTVGASAEPTLPPRDAEEIIAAVIAAEPVAFSGEVTQEMDLGLPALPRDAGVDFTDPGALWSLASGTNTWRVWYDGGHSYRVAIIRGQSESDLISNGSVLWAWSSQSQTAVRTELGAAETPDDHSVPTETPQDAAREMLRELGQYSAVATDENVRVAGRSAYEVVVTPQDDDQTRVAQVRMAVDAETSMPLRLEVYSTVTGRLAVDVGFTRIDYSTPNASVFEFTPPPGAEVVEGSWPTADPQLPTDEPMTPSDAQATPGADATTATPPNPVTMGEGWSQVTITSAGTQGASDSPGTPEGANPLATVLPHISGDWGSGTVLDGTLVSFVFADDGRVAFGAVAPEALYEALAR